MKKIIALLLILACALSFCACDTENTGAGTTQEIAITNENWSEYIEAAILTQPEKNSAEEIINMYCQVVLAFKDEYKDKVVSADIKFDLTMISVEWFFADYTVSTNSISLTPFTDSDLTEYGYSKQQGWSHSGIFSKTNLNGHVYTGFFYGNIGQREINVSADNNVISAHIVLCSDYKIDNISGTFKIKG